MIGRLVFMVNDLISRTALLLDIEEDIGNSERVNHEREIMDCIRYAPTVVDAEVVRHAYWVKKTDLNEGKADSSCSDCGAIKRASVDIKVPYCWKCGAKMDKEKN